MIRILSIAIALVLLATGSGFAADITPNLDKGTKTLSVGGRLDTDTPADFQYDLQVGLGYFFWDNLELGVGAFVGGNDFYKRYDLGVYGQYNISTGSQWVPFLFLGAYYAGMELDNEIYDMNEKTDFDTAVGKAGAGLSWFLRDNISLDLRGVYSFANDNLWVNQDGEAQDTNVTGMIGLRFYFD